MNFRLNIIKITLLFGRFFFFLDRCFKQFVFLFCLYCTDKTNFTIFLFLFKKSRFRVVDLFSKRRDCWCYLTLFFFGWGVLLFPSWGIWILINLRTFIFDSSLRALMPLLNNLFQNVSLFFLDQSEFLSPLFNLQ